MNAHRPRRTKHRLNLGSNEMLPADLDYADTLMRVEIARTGLGPLRFLPSAVRSDHDIRAQKNELRLVLRGATRFRSTMNPPVTIQSFLSPQGIVQAAAKSHPAFKVIVAAAGIISLVAIIAKFGVNYATLSLGAIFLLCLATLFLVFARLVDIRRPAGGEAGAILLLPARIFVYAVLGVFLLGTVAVGASTFGNWPFTFRDWINTRLAVPHDASKLTITLDSYEARWTRGNFVGRPLHLILAASVVTATARENPGVATAVFNVPAARSRLPWQNEIVLTLPSDWKRVELTTADSSIDGGAAPEPGQPQSSTNSIRRDAMDKIADGGVREICNLFLADHNGEVYGSLSVSRNP